jgi:hypothetical protein
MFFNQERRQAGPSPFGPLEENQVTRETDRKEAIKLGKAALAFKGMRAITKGNNAIRGITEAAGDVGEGIMQLHAADSKEKSAIADMDFKIKNAKRQENMGFTKSAQALTASAISSKKAADKAELDKLAAEGKVEEGIAKAAKQTGKAPGAGGAGSKPKPFDVLNEASLAFKRDPSPENKMRYEAAQDAAGMVYSGSAPAQVGAATAADKALSRARYSRDFKKWAKENYGGDMAQAETAFLASHKAGTLPRIFSGSTAAPAPQQTRPAPAGGTTLRFDAQGQPIQ